MPRGSKLANVMFCYALARRLGGTGATSTVLHPGIVRTNFAQDDPAPMIKMVITWFKAIPQDAGEGARTSIYLASSPEVEGVTAEYLSGKVVRKSAKLSHDHAAGERLWHESERLVGLTVTH